MEDILKALVSSRQQGNAAQGADPMADLVGSLLGGGQPQGGGQQGGADLAGMMNLAGSLLGGAQQAQGGGQQAGGLGGMMGVLEEVMGGGQGGSQSMASDPVMMLLRPFVEPLAQKANIPPEIAMIVVSFVAHKLLAHHPASGRDSTEFKLEDMMRQISSGNVNPGLLRSSGMVGELSKRTGLDEATAEKSLQLGFSMVGKSAASLMAKGSAVKKPVSTMKPKTAAGKTLKSVKTKSGVKKK